MEINILLPLLTAIIGSYFTYYFTSRSKREEAIRKNKEEKYTNLLILLQGFVGSTATIEKKIEFFEEQYKSWLYSSDDVVIAINEMVKLVIDSKGNTPNPELGRKAIGNICISYEKRLKMAKQN